LVEMVKLTSREQVALGYPQALLGRLWLVLAVAVAVTLRERAAMRQVAWVVAVRAEKTKVVIRLESQTPAVVAGVREMGVFRGLTVVRVLLFLLCQRKFRSHFLPV
jgi:hypothetical protein